MRKLPSISELYEKVPEKENALNVLLNQPPPAAWIKKHPLSGTFYIPVEHLEYIMTKVFVTWHVEIITYNLLANSLCCHVRVHYKDPVTSEMRWTDGVGAAPVQTDKGCGATDFNAIKSDAIMKALPSAKTFAFKDAVELLGKLFGKDLNRKEDIVYDRLIDQFSKVPSITLLLQEVDKLPKDEADEYKEMIKEKKEAGELTDILINNIYRSLTDK